MAFFLAAAMPLDSPFSAMVDNQKTPFLTAYCRALESERDDPLFYDPLARPLCGALDLRMAALVESEAALQKVVAVRTKIVDDYIRLAVEHRGVDEIINLGAGLDTRPYRMNLPAALVWVEADLPEVVSYKDQKLKLEVPNCYVRRIALDVNNHANLADFLAAAVPGRNNILILTEGFISYLSPKQVAKLAEELNLWPEVRYWIADYVVPEALKAHTRWLAYKFTPADWFSFFEDHGWLVDQIKYLAEEADRLKRPIAQNWTNKKMAGFALLKRRLD
jgi:methyltransferase (TIGR00027 family)